MATPQQVVDGLQARLDTIDGLRAFNHVPDQINPPQAMVMLDRVDYNHSMRDGVIYTAQIMVVVGRMAEQVGQEAIYGYIDPTASGSIRQAIQADRTLGGVVADCNVVEASGLQSVEIANGERYLAVQFTVTVVDVA